MAKTNDFAARFPHAGIFLVIAVAIAIPLTVWSLNNVPTNTQQFASGGNNGQGHAYGHRYTPTPTPTYSPTPTYTPTPTQACNSTGTGGCVTPTPSVACTSLGGNCYNTVSCPIGTTIIQSTSPLCSPLGSNTSAICCK